MMVGSTSYFSDLVKVKEPIESDLKNERTQCASSSQTSETESLSSSQEEEDDVINAFMVDVKYSHGAPTIPYGLSSSQRSSVLVPHYPYGKPAIPKASYQQPWIAPHSN